MNVDWHFWRDDPPKPLEPIEACYSLEENKWMPGFMCRRGCCFRWRIGDTTEGMVLPNFWRLPRQSDPPARDFAGQPLEDLPIG